MPSKDSRSILPSLFAGAGLIMACIVYAEVRARPVVDGGMSSPVKAGAILSASPAHRQEMPEKGRFASIVQRPLFTPTRRPNGQEAAAPALAPALDVTLNGIVISSGEPFALIKTSAGDSLMHVREGDQITGWTVARIEADRVVARQGNIEQQVLLDFGAPAPPSPTTMPAGAQPNGQATGQGSQQNNGQGGTQAAQDEAEPVPPPEADEPPATGQKPSTKTQSK
jgi:type II secretory pathway component PulC